jgi:hypothetical protein
LTATPSRARLFHIGEQSIRLSQFARFDGFLCISFESSDFGIVAGLSRCCFPKGFEARGDFDELGCQPFEQDVLLAENVQRSADLTLVQVQLGLQLRDQLFLRFERLAMLSDEHLELLGRNTDVDGRAADTSANGYAAALGAYAGLLCVRAWGQRQNSDDHYGYEREARHHEALFTLA